MSNETFIGKIERIPVPLLPTLVGAATLANVYSGLGFTGLRHIFMIAISAVMVVYLIKIICYPKTVLGEYSNTVPASLYAGFTMLLMILGSYYFDFSAGFGKALWLTGLILHGLHIVTFTVRNVLLNRDKNTFVPTWYVTYNGVMVSCVVGGVMNEPGILTIITYYGIVVYFIILPIMIWRLRTHELKDMLYHSQAILLAPCSLCLVSYLNIIQEPQAWLVWLLYAAVLLSLLFVITRIPKFFSFAFHPGFAGLTFPMAIGTVASGKMAGYLNSTGNESLGALATQIQGIQIYLTTAIIAFVLFHFLRMFRASMKGK